MFQNFQMSVRVRCRYVNNEFCGKSFRDISKIKILEMESMRLQLHKNQKVIDILRWLTKKRSLTL